MAKIGWFYTVSVGGTVDSIVFNVGDRLIATTNNASTTIYASNWTQLDATDAVTSVNSKTGNVVLNADDISDAATTNKYVTSAEKTKLSNLSGTNSGDQTITNSSDATSHTVTLSGSGGSVQLVEGSGVTLTTTGTGSAGIVTIAASAGGGGTVTSVTSANSDATVATTTTTPVITIVSAPKLTTARTIGTITGDATSAGSTFDGSGNNTNALTVTKLNGTSLAGLATGVLKNTTATGVPFISKVALTEPATAATLTIADNQTLTVNGSATITNGTHSGTNTGDQTNISGNAATVTTNANLT